MSDKNEICPNSMNKLPLSLLMSLAIVFMSHNRSEAIPLKPIFYQMGVNAVNDLLNKQSTNQEPINTQQIADTTGGYSSGDQASPNQSVYQQPYPYPQQNYQNPPYQQYPSQQNYQNQPMYQQYLPQQNYQNQPIYPQTYPNYPPLIYFIPMYPPQRSSPPVIINNF